MHLVGFITKKFVTMRGHMNVKLVEIFSLHVLFQLYYLNLYSVVYVHLTGSVSTY